MVNVGNENKTHVKHVTITYISRSAIFRHVAKQPRDFCCIMWQSDSLLQILLINYLLYAGYDHIVFLFITLSYLMNHLSGNNML